MKKILIWLLIVVAGTSANAQFTEATLQASGLTCSMCSKAVKGALEKVDFVESVKVNIKEQQYVISFKENSNIEFDALKKAVEDAGFSVAALKIKTHVEQIEVEKDKHVTIGGKNFHFLNAKKQPLKGDVVFTIVDKDFLSAKEYKKYAAASSMQCVQTGKAASCCEKGGIPTEARVYHVVI